MKARNLTADPYTLICHKQPKLDPYVVDISVIARPWQSGQSADLPAQPQMRLVHLFS
jgi:hypothetical protein